MYKHNELGKVVKVEKVDEMRAPWGIYYGIFKDSKDNYYYDITDDTDGVANARSEADARECLQALFKEIASYDN